jgi:hypothetical protein
MSNKISPLSKFGKYYFYYHVRLPDVNERNSHKAYRRKNTLSLLKNQQDGVEKKVKKVGFYFRIFHDSVGKDFELVKIQY